MLRFGSMMFALASLALLFAGAAQAACHVVTPSGSGTKSGADWNNAIAGIPKSFVRGDSYYFGSGNYGSMLVSQATSGGSVITLKKARQADHCTDTGYSDSSMGQGQTIFTHMEATTDNWVFDGADRGAINDATRYGFYVDGTQCTTSSCWNIVVISVANIIVKYTAVQGMGDAGADVHVDENVRCISSPNFSLLYSYVYNSSDVPVLARGCNYMTVDHTELFHNRSTTTNHSEGISDGGSSNVTISNSVFADIEGTAAIAELNAGTTSRADNWNIFGNIFYYSPNNAYARKGWGDGAIAVINNQEASNWNIYNNTFANITSSMTLNTRVSFTQSTGSTRYIYNNLWYNCAQADHNGSYSADYNIYLNTDPKNQDTGSHSIIKLSGASDPFVNDGAQNFQLTAHTATGIGNIVGLLFNTVDPLGNVRGLNGFWDRGAFQYVSGSAQTPAAPFGLSAVLN